MLQYKKMRTKKCLILSLVFCLGFSTLQAQITFQKAYHGGLSFDFGQAVQLTSDGGYILTGTSALGAGPSDLYLLKLAADGSIQWAQAYGAAGNEEGFEVQQTADGGYIAVGNTDTRINGGDWDILLVKTAANGNLEWAKSIGNASIEEGRSVLQTSDGGYVVTGRGIVAGNFAVCLLKLDAQGDFMWAKTYGTPGSNAMAESIKQTADGGFIMAGSSSIHGSYDVFLVKTAEDGSLQWTKTFGDSLTDMGYDVAQTADGGYIVAATYGRQFTDSLSSSFYGDVYLIKTNGAGDMQWAKTYGKTMEHGVGYQVLPHADGSYLVTAERKGLYVFKTAANGNLLWSKSYGHVVGTNGGATGRSAAKITPDGGYIIAGSVMNTTTGFDIYLIKTDSTGLSGCREATADTRVDSVQGSGSGGTVNNTLLTVNELPAQTTTAAFVNTLCFTASQEQLTEENSFYMYPNPATTGFILETEVSLNNATLTVYNVAGQVVLSYHHLYGQRLHFERNNLAAGVYYVRITEPNKRFKGIKLVLID